MVESILLSCLPWIIQTFPSFGQFLSVALPICGTVITLVGVFTNLLPAPGTCYSVPDISAIKVELDHHNPFFIKMVIWSKHLVAIINHCLDSKFYKTIYTILTVISQIKTAAFSALLKPKTK